MEISETRRSIGNVKQPLYVAAREVVEEHHLVHVLIRELKKLKPTDEIFQAKFKVLGELVKHHITTCNAL